MTRQLTIYAFNARSISATMALSLSVVACGRSFTATGPVPRGCRPRQHLWQGDGSCASVAAKIRAFSSEVETGSREENASNQEFRAPLRFHRSGKGSGLDVSTSSIRSGIPLTMRRPDDQAQ